MWMNHPAICKSPWHDLRPRRIYISLNSFSTSIASPAISFFIQFLNLCNALALKVAQYPLPEQELQRSFACAANVLCFACKVLKCETKGLCSLAESIHEFMRKKEWNVFDFFFLLSRIPNWNVGQIFRKPWGFLFKNLLFKSLAAFGFLPLPKAYWPSAPWTRSLTPVGPLANASWHSSSAFEAGSPGAKSFCLL